MAEDTTLEAIGRVGWLEPAADGLQKAVGQIYQSAGPGGRKVRNFLHGTWLGHPLHSAVTDVPLGAWTATFVMDAMEEISGRRELRKGADAALAVGLAGAGIAALAGLTDWHKTTGRPRQTGFVHGVLNLSAAALYTGSLAARRKGERETGRGLAFLGFAIGMTSAYLGGKLVYEERIGVDHSRDREMPAEFSDVMSDADLGEGEMKRAEVNGARILVARHQGRVYAIGEECSHMGGPLSNGKLEACVVQCPWHGSRFSVIDGRVIDGPAVHQQPCLQTRVSGGRIEVKR